MVIHVDETLEEIKTRIQSKLRVSDEEFSKVYLLPLNFPPQRSVTIKQMHHIFKCSLVSSLYLC